MLRLKLLLFLLLISFAGFSIPYEFHANIKWNKVQTVTVNNSTIKRLSFDDAFYYNIADLPVFIDKRPIHTSSANVEAYLKNMVFTQVSTAEAQILEKSGFSDTSIVVSARVVISRKEPMALFELTPIRWNAVKNVFEILTKFDIVANVTDIESNTRNTSEYKNESVLASGSWFKIKLNKSGIYKVSYDELLSMGFDVASNPANIAVFGNGGGLLPEKNDEFRYDDLFENPIVVVGGEDGSFDPGDYILFYGEGPIVWKYDAVSKKYKYQPNYYKEDSYYFITSTSGPAKRIQDAEVPSGEADVQVTRFKDYAVHDVDEHNIAGIGRTWFGEIFDYTTEYEFVFDFPNIVKEPDAGSLRGYFAARAFSSSSFQIFINNKLENTFSMPKLPSGERYQYAKSSKPNFNFTPSEDQLIVKIKYLRSSNSSVGFLDFIELNVNRELIFANSQMLFRRFGNINENIAKYNLRQANQDITIWDISTPVNPKRIIAQTEGGSLSFKAEANGLHEFIAFTNDNYLATEFVTEVQNQNLHAYKNIDYLIITHPDFLAEADSLARFHRSYGDLTVLVTTVDQVYNEFSSGGQDITAIRDFAKRLYDNSDPGNELKYLLLFGDASYDYKDIIPDNTNFVPCWESVKSLNIVSSIASDDYFGFLDDGEGPEFNGDLVDIGIGRFVVKNVEEAESALDKTIHYSVNTTKVMAPWRNIVTFIADDGDGNRHLRDAEKLAVIFDTAFKVYNVSKIYLDAYEQIPTPTGQKAPEVNRAINQRIEKGTLIFNYSGHGGETGLGHEQIVQIADINSWRNYDKLSVFITATCEFTRYDDPKRVSAGELVFLNKKGGAISLFTTARATYAGSNLALNRAIYKNNMFQKIDGEYPRFGDIIRKSKKNGSSNDMKFLLVGDPACHMAYPEHRAQTVKINSHAVVQNEPDTIKALQLVKVEGIITNEEGDKLTNFNGEMFSSVYDKKTQVLTYGDDNPQYTFYVRNNVIFNGKSSITNGNFAFEFMVPKDIAYRYGQGKISYYFHNMEDTDGNGYYENVTVGGLDENAVLDTEGPTIELFMNDTTFYPGGITNQNPVLLAFVSDSSGINTTGNGIGHDIVTIVNEDKELTFVLNDYYEADKNHYNKGVVSYPFNSLPDGEHNLSFKVWDVYNNSSTAYLNFLVISAEQLVVENLMNYPNPFVNSTNFVFDHNQSGNEIDVLIEIFRLDGKLVKTLRTRLYPEGHQSKPINWDGTTDSGGKLAAGFYVYNVTVRNEGGSQGSDQAKFIYIR